MKIDSVPDLPPSDGYEKIVTAMVVFSSYLFAYLTSSHDAKMITKDIINTLIEQTYMLMTIISNKGSVFMSQVIK